ncbi:MAG TPA: uracil-DNA glycosylase [Candidatus Megaira endosymbiont of Hartmannula sinica]|nr:uracil-DNA glycosylase [Candidatus Megaera endosymbiont of Hartmannula sinica]
MDKNRMFWLKNMGIKYILTQSKGPYKTNNNIPIFNKQKTVVSSNRSQPETNSENNLMLENIKDLKELENYVINKIDCPLKKFANKCVFSNKEYNYDESNKQIMLIGEAPGATEDLEGRPFCGESGKLLDNIFKSINLYREKELYICNSVFWRPPSNRRPSKEEIEICRPALLKHISLVKPKLIILVGNTANEAIYEKEMNYKHIRDKFLKYKNEYMEEETFITAIFHPAYLLRQPNKKKEMWEKIIKIKEFLR